MSIVRYRGKVDWWWWAIGAALAVSALVLWFISPWTSVLLLACMAVSVWMGVDYWVELREGRVHIRCGFHREEVPNYDIAAARKVRSVLGAPALSFDRIALCNRVCEITMVAVIDEKQFVADLEERIRCACTAEHESNRGGKQKGCL